MPNPIKKTKEEIIKDAWGYSLDLLVKLDNGTYGLNTLNKVHKDFMSIVSNSLNRFLDAVIEAGPEDIRKLDPGSTVEDYAQIKGYNQSNFDWRQLLREGKE